MPKSPAIVLLLFVLSACSPATDTGTEGDSAETGPAVVATTGIVGDSAKRILGDLGVLTSLMGPGIDPHLYKASESDVRKLAEADLILYNGLHLEGKMGDILVKMARTRPVVAVSEQVPQDALREPPEFAGQYDPHIWFNVGLWSYSVDPIVDALVALLPEQGREIRSRGDEWRQELVELDRWVAARIAEIPEGDRMLVTAHDAFGYFGERYGIEVIGIQGISTLTEAGLQDVERVVDLVVERQVKAIFIESSVSRRSIEAVIAACADRGHTVTIGGELFSDALGASDTPEGTYAGMVRHNVNTIVEALK